MEYIMYMMLGLIARHTALLYIDSSHMVMQVLKGSVCRVATCSWLYSTCIRSYSDNCTVNGYQHSNRLTLLRRVG